MKNAILIAGPTASGKSALALALAEKHGGFVVNADSMQVYSILSVLTARPGMADLARAPHVLYGHVHPATPYSTGSWTRDVATLADIGRFEGNVPIFVGGTGLYFRALTEGLSEMPEVPDAVRARLRDRLKAEGPERLHTELARKDPKGASQLRSGDSQRIVRALEVLEASGRPLAQWQAGQGVPLVDRTSARLIVLEVERAELVRRIDRRFDAMIEQGAMEEARAIAALRLDPALPAMKAIGVRELIAADAGEIPVADAIERAKIATRQYAKRQATWFRHQLGPEWTRVGPGFDITRL